MAVTEESDKEIFNVHFSMKKRSRIRGGGRQRNSDFQVLISIEEGVTDRKGYSHIGTILVLKFSSNLLDMQMKQMAWLTTAADQRSFVQRIASGYRKPKRSVIVVDNSNVFIEGQKHSVRMKGIRKAALDLSTMISLRSVKTR